jgi:hypothetical protein
MRVMIFLVGIFACIVWDIARNQGAWIRSASLLIHQVLRTVGLA